MAKRKIEIQEPEVEVAQLIDLDENEKKPVWYRTGIWATVAAIGGVAAAALYEIYKSSKESPAPAVDMFKGPSQPIVPHIEPEKVEVEAEPVVKEVVKEEPKKEEPKPLLRLTRNMSATLTPLSIIRQTAVTANGSPSRTKSS